MVYKFHTFCCQYSLEVISSVFVAEEGNRVGQHPDVAATAVVIWLRPPAILVLHRQGVVLDPLLRPVRIEMEGCKKEAEERIWRYMGVSMGDIYYANCN